MATTMTMASCGDDDDSPRGSICLTAPLRRCITALRVRSLSIPARSLQRTTLAPRLGRRTSRVQQRRLALCHCCCCSHFVLRDPAIPTASALLPLLLPLARGRARQPPAPLPPYVWATCNRAAACRLNASQSQQLWQRLPLPHAAAPSAASSRLGSTEMPRLCLPPA